MNFLLSKIFLATTSFIVVVQAETTGDCAGDSCLSNPLGGVGFKDIVDKVARGLLTVSIPIMGIMVLIGGFQIMTAGGNSEKVEQGKKVILYAVIGFAIILMANTLAFILKDFIIG